MQKKRLLLDLYTDPLDSNAQLLPNALLRAPDGALSWALVAGRRVS